jgi:hypothetical protein
MNRAAIENMCKFLRSFLASESSIDGWKKGPLG